MSEHHRFNYRNGNELRQDAERLGLHLPWSDDLTVLNQAVSIGTHTAPNRFIVLPVEGRDSNSDGTPSEMTRRRYRRYAAGGAGTIHFEAVAIWQQGRSSDLQLMISEKNTPAIKSLVNLVRQTAAEQHHHNVICIMQLQESGRYRHASGTIPGLVVPSPEFDTRARVPAGTPLMTDEQLDEVLQHLVYASVLAYQAGFDGVDVKACHRYLLSELLAAKSRGGRYGGTFENRTRMILEAIDLIRKTIHDPKFLITSRLNLYDAIVNGWGVSAEGLTPDLSEPLKLIGLMKSRGVSFVSTTCGTPYGRAWINRPFDRVIPGSSPAPEHPLESVCRGLSLTEQAQHAYPDLPMSTFGCAWLRQYLPNVSAGIITEGGAQLIGLGRMAFAYPNLPADIAAGRPFDENSTCVTCSLCSQYMAAGGHAGCYIRDREVYKVK